MTDPVLDAPISEIHVIAVDASLTPGQAWEELVEHGLRRTYTGGIDSWAVIRCSGVECQRMIAMTDT